MRDLLHSAEPYVCGVILRWDIAGAIGGIGGAETFDTILTSVNCQGTESSILDCPAMNSTECVSQEIATVICQGT